MSKRKIIHVNRHHILANSKDGGSRPVYTIKEGGKTHYAREVFINGPSRLVYEPAGLSCGAKAWVETYAAIDMVDQMTYQDSLKVGLDESVGVV